MERGSNLNVPSFWKGALSYYAVCNNNPQCVELWVQLSKTANNQGPQKYESIFIGCCNGRGYCIYLIVICFISMCDMIWYGMIRYDMIYMIWYMIWYDMIYDKIWYICKLQLGCHPVAAIQYTFTHKQYTEHNTA